MQLYSRKILNKYNFVRTIRLFLKLTQMIADIFVGTIVNHEGQQKSILILPHRIQEMF